jgi:hypothetical protein
MDGFAPYPKKFSKHRHYGRKNALITINRDNYVYKKNISCLKLYYKLKKDINIKTYFFSNILNHGSSVYASENNNDLTTMNYVIIFSLEGGGGR